MHGSAELTAAIIASGSVNIDQGDPMGSTPLMYCSLKGYTPVARVLLDRGADVSPADDDGVTALHISAQAGHVEICKLLLKAGASLKAKTSDGSTPLHLSGQKGNCGVMRVLIEAGANVNSRMHTGATPLYLAAEEGELMAIRELLRAKADPLLPSNGVFVPLDMATQNGDVAVVRELVDHAGVKGCGGDSCGAQALRLAAEEQHIDIMIILVAAGVVDTGAVALGGAADYGLVRSVKLLFDQCAGGAAGKRAYVNTRNTAGITPLIGTIWGGCPGAPRVARLLIDAGADTEACASVPGMVYSRGTPLIFVITLLHMKKIKGEPATEQQLRALEAVRRLLLRVGAVHAVSWLWAIDDAPRIARRAVAEGATREQAPSAPLARMLPTLRRRAGNRGVLLADLFR